MVFKTMVYLTTRRIPLIKFRKGGLAIAGDGVTEQSQSTASTTAETSATASSAPAIEDWELPPRYWRKPIDPVEMEYINRGGPA